MTKIKLPRKQRRIVIILMAINLFAVFVNLFSFSPKFKDADSAIYFLPDRIFLLTDSGQRYNDHQFGAYGKREKMNTTDFWPFTKFIDCPYYMDDSSSFCQSTFRGIFADYDYTEFIVYTLLIFGVFFVKKVW